MKSNPVDFYDYIFLDINMPIMNGLEACEAISKYLKEKSFQDLLSVREQKSARHKKPKIIAVTADVSRQQMVKLYRLDFTKVIDHISHE